MKPFRRVNSRPALAMTPMFSWPMMTGASLGGGLVELDVGAADAGDLHLHQRGVLGDLRHGIFADLGPARPGPHRRQHFFHGESPSPLSRRSGTPACSCRVARHASARSPTMAFSDCWVTRGTASCMGRHGPRELNRPPCTAHRQSAGTRCGRRADRAWTRARFALPEDAVILVSEIACGLPGCPPLETVVAFWTDDRRHRFKLFKPAGRGCRRGPAVRLAEGRARRRRRPRLLLNRTPQIKGATSRKPRNGRSALKTVTRTQGNNRRSRTAPSAAAASSSRSRRSSRSSPRSAAWCAGIEFDICEMAMTTYICARAARKRDDRDAGVPGARLPSRRDPGQPARPASATPKDLEGRRVGVNRGYTVTTGVWARGILQDEHGVDLSKITWVLSGDEHVAEYRPPAERGADRAGQEDGRHAGVAASSPPRSASRSSIPDVQPLIPNAARSRPRGAAPRRPLSDQPRDRHQGRADRAHPDLAADVFEAFAEAKRRLCRRACKGGRDREADRGATDVHRRVMEIVGDPLPYGIEPNRAVLDGTDRPCADAGHHHQAGDGRTSCSRRARAGW